MSKKILFLSCIVITITATIIRGMPDFPYVRRIAESDIPIPDVQYELPKELVGDFVIISSSHDLYITIFPIKFICYYFWGLYYDY